MLCVFFLSRRFISGNRLRLRPSCIHVNTVTEVPIKKLHKNPFGGRQAVPCRKVDRETV